MDNESKFYKILRYVLLVLASLFVVIPFVPVLFMSLKTGAEVKSTSYFTPPQNWFNGYNFRYAIEVGDLAKSFGVTMIVMVISLMVIVTFTAMVSYVLQRFEFRGRKLILLMFTMTMFIPIVTTQVVVFQFMYTINLVNTIWSIILIYCGVSIVDIYIMLNLLSTIPKELDEAAWIDGANLFQTFFLIILPLLKPAIVTIAVIRGIGIYNDFYTPNLYLMSGPKTLTVALYKFYSGLSTPYEVVSAAVIIATVPVIIIFLFLQRYIYDGLGGAVKS